MSDYRDTKLGVMNGLRSAAKVRRLTSEQLGVPSGDSGAQTEDEKWEVLEDAARDVLGTGEVAAAVRTDDGTVSSATRIEAEQSHPVHALELAVWKAYSESGSSVTEAVVVAGEGLDPCGRCLQVLVDFAFDVTPVIRMIDTATEESMEQELDGLG